MLVKAAASGIDVNSIVNGLNQPIGLSVLNCLIQKALELASEVRGLGSSLLSAWRSATAKHLALLRPGQERQIQRCSRIPLSAMETVRRSHHVLVEDTRQRIR